MKWWKKISLWNRLKLTFGALGAGGELWMHLQDAAVEWRVYGVVCTALAIIITNWFQDNNNNGIVDIMEDENAG
jgi:hypothetical protein